MMAFNAHEHSQSREADLMGALGSLGEEISAMRTLGTWPLGPDARAVFVAHVRSCADTLDQFADELGNLWKKPNV